MENLKTLENRLQLNSLNINGLKGAFSDISNISYISDLT